MLLVTGGVFNMDNLKMQTLITDGTRLIGWIGRGKSFSNYYRWIQRTGDGSKELVMDPKNCLKRQDVSR